MSKKKNQEVLAEGTTPEENINPAEEAPKEPKEKSEGQIRTEGFKETLQGYFNEQFGIKISKEAAWKAFKGLIALVVGDVISKGRLSLSGVGVFEIQKCGPRKSRIGKFNYVPKFRFRPSTKIDTHLIKVDPDCLVPGVTLDEALRIPDEGGNE